MKKNGLLLCLICTACIIISCAGNPGNPKAVLIAFFDAMAKKDIEGAKALSTKDSKMLLDKMEIVMKMPKDSSKMDKFNKLKVEFGEPVIEGDKATISVTEKVSKEDLNFILKVENGNWKVAFDKATIVEMGMQKAKDLNPDELKKMSEDFEKMKVK